MHLKKKIIIALGYDLSTTGLGLVGITSDGELVYVFVPIQGVIKWLGQPAHDLSQLLGLFMEALGKMIEQGFEFAPGGVISGSVRQHDMVLADANGYPIRPALSWQCNVATEQVEQLKQRKAEETVGRLEPRQVLPKLLWALQNDPNLRGRLRKVMTTGDWIASQLTGTLSFNSSEACSNGLLDQKTRQLAWGIIGSVAGLDINWFPPVVQSGQIIQSNRVGAEVYLYADWAPVRALLTSWRVVAGLGDNHAGAVGSGLTDNRDTIVISAGTSGTVVRAVELGALITGTAMRFEFYEQNTLLLSMMGDCASWYGRFVEQLGCGSSHAQLDDWALHASRVRELPYPKTPATPFPNWLNSLTLGEKVRSMQYSIARVLAGHFGKILGAVPDDASHHIKRVVLTGGLTRSRYFREALKVMLVDLRLFEGEVLVSSRTGPLADQAATLGALINALVGGGLYPSREAAIKELCPTRKI